MSSLQTLRLDTSLPMPESGAVGQEAHSSGDRRFLTGTWCHAGGKLDATQRYDEVCVILAGRVRLTNEAGEAREYAAGDSFVIPKGFKGIWETLEPVRKHYVIYDVDLVRT
jgi:uncharacterized cupin superfamily protein